MAPVYRPVATFREVSPFRAAAAALLVACVLGGCAPDDGTSDGASGAPSSATTPRTSPDSGAIGSLRSYVALGDSYTSAPYVGITDLAGGCLRSDANYPHLLAAATGMRLTDVSCAGATTADVLRPQPAHGSDATIPPQLAAVRRDTDVVTIGLGGNDGRLFGRLSQGCADGHCDLDTSDTATALRDVGAHLSSVVHAVRRKAPDAVVVVVGYPRIVDQHVCPKRLPLEADDIPDVAALTRELRNQMRAAARRTDALFLDLYAASAGHDVCSKDPWVNGIHTQRMKALALHPFASEQRAAADLLEDLLRAHVSG